MPFLKELVCQDETHVFIWMLTETVDDLKNLCLRRGIPIEEVNQVKATNRKCEILTERLLLQIIFGEPVTLMHQADGSPYVLEKDIFISISHTFGNVCVATNHRHRIGIDIERKGTRVIRVRNKFLNELELRWIDENDAEANLTAWTAKEALYKMVGEKGIELQRDLQLEPFESHPAGNISFKAHFTKHIPMVEFDIVSFSFFDYILTLVVNENPLPKY